MTITNTITFLTIFLVWTNHNLTYASNIKDVKASEQPKGGQTSTANKAKAVSKPTTAVVTPTPTKCPPKAIEAQLKKIQKPSLLEAPSPKTGPAVEGRLRREISAIEKLIARDEEEFKKAEQKYEKQQKYTFSPHQRKVQAVAFESHTQKLRMRLATHKALLEKWQGQLIETTGKMEE